MKQIVSVLFVAALAAVVAQAQHPRTPLFEEFTSSTCGPCYTVKPYVTQFAEQSPDVVTVTYHMNWPAEGDPYNVYNPTDNDKRRAYYSVTGIPDAYMSGTKLYPNSVAAMRQAADQVKSRPTPLAMTLTEDRTKNPIEVTVTLKNDGTTAITGAKLQVMVLNYYADLTAQLQGQNQHYYRTFEYAMLKALPDANGTAISLAAGEQKAFTFTYSRGTGSVWVPNMQYVIAFVQLDQTKEVLQAASTLNDVLNRVEITSAAPRFGLIARGTTYSHELTISNPTTRAQTVALRINSTSSLIPNGWNITLNPQQLSLQPGEEKSVTVQYTAPNAGGFAMAVVNAYPQGNGINDTATFVTGYMAEQTKYAIIYGYMGSGITPFIQAITSGTKYASETAVIPPAAAVELDLPCEAIVLPIDYAGRGALQNQTLIDKVVSWIQAKKRLFICGQLEAYYAFNVQGGLATTRNFFLNTLGVRGVQLFPITIGATTYQNPYYHFTYDSQGSITGVTTFTVQGVANDPISNGVNVTCNQSTQYYNLYTDVLQLATGSPAVPIFRYDNNTQYIGGIRVETNDTRIVYTTFGLEAISNTAARNQLAQNIMDWLTAAVAPQPKIELVQTTGTNVIQFEPVAVGSRKAHTFMIRNSGTADLVVSEIAMDQADQAEYGDVFVITDGGTTPITIAPGGEHSVTIEFRPKKVEDIQAAVFHIRSNGGDVDLTVLGDGVVSSVEPTEAVAGALSLKLAPNPVTTDATVTFAVNGSASADLVLLDARGAEVATLAAAATGEHTIRLDASALSSGIYRLVLRSGAERVSVPVVVVK
ncbi:MAG: Omp28-related outer membrane protein [Chlorobi bacterium]|nr:Omp28-related outer membrane protein [Chlorobiota bacterium]